jgi:hypothetical protein
VARHASAYAKRAARRGAILDGFYGPACDPNGVPDSTATAAKAVRLAREIPEEIARRPAQKTPGVAR